MTEERNVVHVHTIGDPMLDRDLTDLQLEQIIGGLLIPNQASAKRISRELLALRESNRWIPVSERLPKKYVEVAVLRPDAETSERVVGCAYLGEWWVLWGVGISSRGDITHWRPLPAAPEVQA